MLPLKPTHGTITGRQQDLAIIPNTSRICLVCSFTSQPAWGCQERTVV